MDLVVAGGGAAGHVAALQAARAGAKTAVIEAGTMLGGTMTAAAALAVKRGVPSREIDAADIVALTIEHGAAAV